MSPATIDRLMIKMRKKLGKLGLATTKPGSILKSHIPIKTNQWDETRPGYLESDTVAHCGTSIAGSFVYTVNTASSILLPDGLNKEHCGVKAIKGCIRR